MSYRNKIKKKSVYIYHEFANILKNKNDSDPPQPQNFLHQLMLGLFYPAVLGTIFYSFFQFLNNATPKNSMQILIIVSILLHFSFDYIQTITTPKYQTFTFLLDILGLYCLYFAYKFVIEAVIFPLFLIMGFLYIIYAFYDKKVYHKFKFYILFFVIYLVVFAFLYYFKKANDLSILFFFIAASIRMLFLIGDDLEVLKKKINSDL